jgi:hypothetical protein
MKEIFKKRATSARFFYNPKNGKCRHSPFHLGIEKMKPLSKIDKMFFAQNV